MSRRPLQNSPTGSAYARRPFATRVDLVLTVAGPESLRGPGSLVSWSSFLVVTQLRYSGEAC